MPAYRRAKMLLSVCLAALLLTGLTAALALLGAWPEASGDKVLKKGGMISLCIYSGGDTGFEERDLVLSWLAGLDSRRYLVIRSDYMNRPNHPPVPVLIIRLK